MTVLLAVKNFQYFQALSPNQTVLMHSAFTCYMLPLVHIYIIIFAGRTLYLTSNLKFHILPRKLKVLEQQRLKRRRNPSTVNCKTLHLTAASCNPQGDSVLRLLGTQTGLFFSKYYSCSLRKGRRGKQKVSSPKRTPYREYIIDEKSFRPSEGKDCGDLIRSVKITFCLLLQLKYNS